MSSSLRQRRSKLDNNKTSPVSSSKNADHHDETKKKDKIIPSSIREHNKRHDLKIKMTGKQLLLFLTVLFSLVTAIIYPNFKKYGWNVILGTSRKDFKWTPHQWRKFIDTNQKSFLIIGGPHRSGTTVLWKSISSHPDVAGFGDSFETGVDFSEGVLFQDVYPRFGVGLEFKTNFGKKNTTKENELGGLGKYALLPEEKVHWTKTSQAVKLNDPNVMSRVLNRFAPYWDKSPQYKRTNGLQTSKVFVEKSPQNAVLSLFLEGLYNMNVQEDGSVKPLSIKTNTVTKFLFVTRDPIANSYALDKFISENMGGHVDFDTLLRNYIQLHKYMKMDANDLDSPVMWVRLEDFSSNPKDVLNKIFLFLGVPVVDEEGNDIVNKILDNIGPIYSSPNGKYFQKWCDESKEFRKKFEDEYNADIKRLQLGYDLTKICK